jgi:hypothetical protein
MKTTIRFFVFVLLFSWLGLCTYSQGTVGFWTLSGGTPRIDAPVTFARTGERLGNGFFAQLYVGPAGAPVVQLQAQGPILAFVDGPRAGYIYPGQTVTFEGFDPGVPVTIDMKAFNGGSWEESNIRGESNPLQIILGGREPAFLTGLQPFTVDNVPEPHALVLFVMGAAALIFSARRGERRERVDALFSQEQPNPETWKKRMGVCGSASPIKRIEGTGHFGQFRSTPNRRRTLNPAMGYGLNRIAAQ